jgi:formylmethanofuran dehydrogenase subunit C
MLHLRYHGTGTIPLEAECISPDVLAGKSTAEIAALSVLHGNVQARLGEFFHVAGDAGDGAIVVEGDCRCVKWMGACMTHGSLHIHGHAGMHLGAALRGGEIHVHGNAGDWVGAEMRGGRIHIHGNAGHLVGAAYRGSRAGMRGGVLLVEGNAGDEVGAGMRRGLIAIGGSCGDFAGVSLIAGSLLLFGPCGARPGAGMKRGTLAFLGPPPTLLGSFRPACIDHPLFLTLFLRQLHRWSFPFAERFLDGAWQRYTGDHVTLGKGEVLVWLGTVER